MSYINDTYASSQDDEELEDDVDTEPLADDDLGGKLDADSDLDNDDKDF